MALASLTACGAGRAAPAKESTAKRVANPDESTTSGTSPVTFTTAAPLVAGPPLARGEGATGSGSTGATVPAGEATGSTTATPDATVPGSSSAPASCRAHDLQVSFDLQPAGGTQPLDRTRALIVLTNVSAAACTLQGYAAVDVVESDHWKSLDVRHFFPPGSTDRVVLPGGGSAFAGMEWTSAGGCPPVSAFRLLLPGRRAPMHVVVAVPGGDTGPVAVCTADVELGPFTPMSQGTVEFPDSVRAGT